MHFTARYVFGLEDYKLLTAAVRQHHRARLWLFRLGMLGALLSVAAVQQLLSGPGPALSWSDQALSLLPFIFVYALSEILIFHTNILVRLAYKKAALADKPLVYGLSDAGVTWQRDGTRGEYAWPICLAVEAVPGALAMQTSKAEWMLLPARAFASQEEFEAAQAFVRAKVAGAKGQPEPAPAVLPAPAPGGPAAYAVRYVFSLEDFMQLMKAADPEGMMGRLRTWLLLGMFLITCARGAFDVASNGFSQGFWDWASNFGVLAALSGAALLYFQSGLFRRLQFRQLGIAGKEVDIQLSEKGLAWAREGGMHGEFDWTAFTAVKVTPIATVLLMGKQGMVLPARAFASKEEFEAATAFARARAGN